MLVTSAAARLAAAQDTTVVAHAPPPPLPVQVHGFLEVYYRAGDPTARDGYRLRKADLKFSGDLSPELRWRVTFDAAKALSLNTTTTEVGDTAALAAAAIDQKSRILQDAALTYQFNRDANVDVGQQVIPLTLEGSIPTYEVETIERANFIVERSRAVGLGDVRDIGVSANGKALNLLEYHAGLFNEAGDDQGSTDPNDQKTVIGRLVLHPPIIPGLQLGGSGAFQGGPAKVHRERLGGEAQYKLPFFTLRAEAMGARDGLLHRFGWYGLGAVRPTKQLQLVARYDAWDRDLSNNDALNNAFERSIVVGGSYALSNAPARFAINLVRQDFPNVTTVPSGTFLLVAFEGAW